MTSPTTFNETFIDCCEKEIGTFLTSYGFKQTEHFAEIDGAHLTYTNEEQEIIIYSNTNPQDYPCYFNVCFKLNDGAILKPEDQKLPLWYIKFESTGKKSQEYNLSDSRTMALVDPDRLPWIIKAARRDLENFNLGFLVGKTDEFVRIRQKRIEKKAYR